MISDSAVNLQRCEEDCQHVIYEIWECGLAEVRFARAAATGDRTQRVSLLSRAPPPFKFSDYSCVTEPSQMLVPLFRHAVGMTPCADGFRSAPWQDDRSPGVGRDCNRELAFSLLPVRNHRSVGRVAPHMELWQGPVEVRVDGEVLITGSSGVRVDAGCPTIDPRHHRAERVVVVRIHAGDAVPALPPSRCTLSNHVASGRIGVR
jgi:hypothetical protein